MRFLSLWLYPKAAATPRAGKGPGAVGVFWAATPDGRFTAVDGSEKDTD